MPDNHIFIHHLAVLEETLGPGRRLVIWTTGCPYRCEACIEDKLRDLEYGSRYQVAHFFAQIRPTLTTLQAVTFSGGEPLMQREACGELFDLIKKNEDIDIMLYTGMSTEEFNREYTEFHPYIDICVTEPFVVKLHANHLWRGSSNQKIISPSGRHQAEIEEWMGLKSSGIRVHFNESRSYVYGIPAPDTMPELERILQDKQVDICKD